MTTYADVALLTDRRYTAKVASADDWYLANILQDDAHLQAALEERGISSVRVDWSDPSIEWSKFRCAVFRSTWDYFDRIDEFKAWLRVVETQTRLCNSSQIVWWNLDKHYLADLERHGIPIVPSLFIEQGSLAPLSELLATTSWHEAVVKPCVSGAARHTYRVNRESIAAIGDIVQPLLESESFILQPFFLDVLEHGEDTLVLIGGRCTHAVRKLPRPGDFRVQDDHGGTTRPIVPDSAQIELASKAMAACAEICGQVPAYGRVDLVRDSQGNLAVIELELIEPELWLRNEPSAAKLLADAITGQL